MIEDNVEIGANVTVDRGVCGATRIGRGTKIDNLVQVGHNVEIGEDCLVVAMSGIAGSSRIGNRVTLAGQSGVAGHLTVGRRVRGRGQRAWSPGTSRPILLSPAFPRGLTEKTCG